MKVQAEATTESRWDEVGALGLQDGTGPRAPGLAAHHWPLRTMSQRAIASSIVAVCALRCTMFEQDRPIVGTSSVQAGRWKERADGFPGL